MAEIYEHGISSTEIATNMEEPQVIASAVGVILGTAPIHLTTDPYNATNIPILAYNIDEVKNKLGYSDDFTTYTLCQSMYMRFIKYNIGPVIFVNVLDPKLHIETIEETEQPIENGKILLKVPGVLLDTITVRSADSETNYEVKRDYITSFDEDGTVIISIPSDSAVTGGTAKIGYTKLRPDKVTFKDVIGGYDTETRKRKGMACLSKIYNQTRQVPSHLLAPGWSQNPLVAATLQQAARSIGQLFRAIALLDMDSVVAKDINELENYKIQNGYDDEYGLPCYPMALVDGKKIYMSAIEDVAIALKDQDTEGPYKSPSNQKMAIDGLCLGDGEEVEYDLQEANKINSQGITTMYCMGGWRTWGNEMGCYPRNKDTKDRYISARRTFNYRDALFKISFFDKVDDNTNKNQIDYIVNGENKTLATLASEGKIAGGSISFDAAKNTKENILEGKIEFDWTLSPFTPMKSIHLTQCFDPNLNMDALGIEEE